jgi:MinD superfamily P-loop ATPase
LIKAPRLRISVASGKGGTGKTIIACGLAAVTDGSVYIDCDVEEPNGHILLKPDIFKEEPVFKLIPEINYDRCSFCNKCIEICEFNALHNLKSEIYLYEELCHSCGACSYFCPDYAITEVERETGKIRFGEIKDDKFFIDAYLKVGEMSAAPLIRKVKNAYKGNRQVIIDSPPGTSCSMQEAVKDSDFCVLVTESTPFGLNDLKLAVEVLQQLSIPFGIVINKYDKNYSRLDEYIHFNMLNSLIRIPFRMDIAGSYSKGELTTESIEDFRLMMIELMERIKINTEKNYASQEV